MLCRHPVHIQTLQLCDNLRAGFRSGRTLLLSVNPCPSPVDWTAMFHRLAMSDGSGVPNSPNRGRPVSLNAFHALLSTKLQDVQVDPWAGNLALRSAA